MDESGRVHPRCANAANPYHECGVYCLEKVAEGKGRKEKDKKKLGNQSSFLCSISNFIFVKHVISTESAWLLKLFYSMANPLNFPNSLCILKDNHSLLEFTENTLP